MSNLQTGRPSVNEQAAWPPSLQTSPFGPIRTPDLPPEPNMADNDDIPPSEIETFQAEEDQVALDATLAIATTSTSTQVNKAAWIDLRRVIRSRVFKTEVGILKTSQYERDGFLLLSLRAYVATGAYHKPEFDAPRSIAGQRRLMVANVIIRRLEVKQATETISRQEGM